MATFQYIAVKKGKKDKVKGTINAESEGQARQMLRKQELYPTSVKPLKSARDKKKKAGKKSRSEEDLFARFQKVGLTELMTFTQNMAIMSKAGIPVTEALLYMETYTEKLVFKEMINQIRNDLMSGYSLSQALGRQPNVFNQTYVSIVQAGEASGELEAVLNRLRLLLGKQAALKKKVITAMVYPAVVVFFVIIAILVSLLFVIPTFNEIYSQMGIKLPLITKIMVFASDVLLHFWYIILAVLGATIFAVLKWRKTDQGRYMIDKATISIPVLSPVVIAASASYFVSTLEVAFSAGLPITDSIFMACRTVQHGLIRSYFEQVNLEIQAGQRLAASLANTGIMPDMVIVMISTGEEAGSLEEMLRFALEFLDEEVDSRIGLLMSLMEPALLFVMGGIVGVLALAIYMPLFGMYDQL
ncbi:MAG: type II secretion system F family protein [Cyanobacteria bacterium HKST-UBA04]|nr:type II secretion system F family protein [Cyanobacteria bacterium HKST-UBA04]